jgi:hypothetical protein
MNAKTPEPVGPPPPRRSCVLGMVLGGALLFTLAISCSTSSDRLTTYGVAGAKYSGARRIIDDPKTTRMNQATLPEPPVKCVDFTMRNGWLSSYPSLAAGQAPWGHYFANYLAQALWRLDRQANTARRFDDTNRPPNLRALELVCLGELLAVQPNPGGTNASQCELRLEYELKSTRRTPAVLLEKREVAVAGGYEADFDESSLHQLLKLAAERVAENVNRTLPSMINGTR